jgi:hypothetical protein
MTITIPDEIFHRLVSFNNRFRDLQVNLGDLAQALSQELNIDAQSLKLKALAVQDLSKELNAIVIDISAHIKSSDGRSATDPIFEHKGSINQCSHCGSLLPHWHNLPNALEAQLSVSTLPTGLRPMILQAIAELRSLKGAEDAQS